MEESPAGARPLYIGVNLPARQGVSNQDVVDAALAQGYDLITARVTARAYRRRVQALYAGAEPDPAIPPPAGDELVVYPGPHVSNTIALCAPWAELDSKDERLANVSYRVLAHELAYAKFCGLPYVVIEGPRRRTHLARYAHALQRLLRAFPDLKVLLHTTFTEDFRDDVQPPPDVFSTWDVWDGVRVLCDYPQNLGIALEVQRARLPDAVVARWLCEPVLMLVLSEARAFVPNPKNYPVLPRHTQAVLRRFAALRPFLLVKENLGPQKAVHFAGGDDACLIYLRNMLARPPPSNAADAANVAAAVAATTMVEGLRLSHASRHVDSAADNAGSARSSHHEAHASAGGLDGSRSSDGGHHADASRSSDASRASDTSRLSRLSDASRLSDGAAVAAAAAAAAVDECHCAHYADVLETPLQPLRDALDSSVYEVFETDATKYDQYFRAVAAALDTLLGASAEPLVVAVLGAGRGALVDRVLDALAARGLAGTTRGSAAAAAAAAVQVYAVEKHAGPAAYLHARRASERAWECVEVVHADLRAWTPPRPARLVVSELLGSLGDNELSPECLVAVERNPRVLASGGVVIPAAYAAYVAPVFCPQLWAQARARGGAGLETPYVVCLHQAERLAPPARAWQFEHRAGSPAAAAATTRRSAKLAFAAAASSASSASSNGDASTPGGGAAAAAPAAAPAAAAAPRSRVHGFAGYFEADLFGGITLSTRPGAATPGLTSWFPMYFPLQRPLDIAADATIELSLWRERDARRVWYEWAVETHVRRARGAASTIHNVDGHAQSIEL